MQPPAEGLASRLFLVPALRTQPDRRLVALVREGYEDHSGPSSPSSGPGREGDDDRESDRDRHCTAADLTEGATVEEAELKLSAGKAVFEEVELAD